MQNRSQRPARQGSSTPTIADVARLCGVSPMTVSRVINGERNVRESTRELVLAKIAEINYSPNPAARSLAGGDQVWIGLLYSNPSASYLSEFLIGLLEQASLSHAQLVVTKCDDSESEISAARRMIANGLDGLILAPPICDSPGIADLLATSSVSTVAVAAGALAGQVSSVGIDDKRAAQAMTTHLLSMGHRRIGFVIGDPEQSASAARLEGYREALKVAGIAHDPALEVQGRYTYRSGIEAAEALLALSPRPTAVFASNDDMAAAVVNVALRSGLSVPKDLSVCGFDDTELARAVWPELTTIRQPVADMARAALDLLVHEIKARRSEEDVEISYRQLDYQLIRRGSDGPPARRAPAQP